MLQNSNSSSSDNNNNNHNHNNHKCILELHTECICSLIHSTNPLPPIPSASDSIKAAKNQQINIVVGQKQIKLVSDRCKNLPKNVNE